jgi:anti-sigma factor RsiW
LRRLEHVESRAPQAAGAAVTPRVARPAARWTALGAALGFAAAVALFTGWMAMQKPAGGDLVVREAVSDHLRIAFSEHPVEVASGGIHQVKPWFSGKLDFAPVIRFSGDDEFPLVGGSVAYFVDRKAAAFVFKRRLHNISLFVFPAGGFAFPNGAGKALNGVRVAAESLRGFNVLLWQEQGLGYALVSDLDRAELEQLAGRITAN